MEFDVVIRGTGSYIPRRVFTNNDFAQILDTSDEWIRTRTGIVERRLASPGETNSLMAAHAGKLALEMASVSAEEVEVIAVPTVTPERVFPATAALVQARLGAVKAACFDLEAACSGFIYALACVTSMLRTGMFRNALVIGSEVMSAITNFTDRNQCVLFGDAASAFYLEAVPKADYSRGVLHFHLGSDGTQVGILYQYAGGSAQPPTFESVRREEHFIHMEGQEVFKRAVRVMYETVHEVLRKANCAPSEVDWFIGHQANERILRSTRERLGVSPEKLYINIDRYGNTTAASIPLCVDELNRAGKIKRGDKIVLFAFGAGLSWASAFIIWD